MGLLRRIKKAGTDSTEVEAEPVESAVVTAPQGKGRPTPKRREAQGRPRGPVPPPPRTRREAYRRMREQNAMRRADARRAVRSGDDRFLPQRDQGAVRGLVRDIVDSRRNAGGAFLFVAVIVFVGYFTPNVRIRAMAVSLWMVVFLLIIVDSAYLGFRIRRIVNERFPDRKETTKSLVWYGITRATMIRRWRMPAPRVRVGEPI